MSSYTVKRRTAPEIESIFSLMEQVETSDEMKELARLEGKDGGDGAFSVFLDKNDGQMICLCEDGECQFNEELVNSLDDVVRYLDATIKSFEEAEKTGDDLLLVMARNCLSAAQK